MTVCAGSLKQLGDDLRDVCYYHDNSVVGGVLMGVWFRGMMGSKYRVPVLKVLKNLIVKWKRF